MKNESSLIVSNISKKFNFSFANFFLRKKNDTAENLILDNISFSLFSGDALGILGLNGAGKSTLLKIISGVLKPSSGSYFFNGLLTSILELGIGFDPESNGYNNIRSSLKLFFSDRSYNEDEIIKKVINFSELSSNDLSKPLKYLSTGMQMRLSFSTATALRPDILIIDEALAVGDYRFQNKCIERIKSYIQDGTTLLFVSHDPSMVAKICNKSLVLKNSSMIFFGKASEGVQVYNKSLSLDTGNKKNFLIEDYGNKKVIISDYSLIPNRNTFEVNEKVILKIKLKSEIKSKNITCGFVIKDVYGNNIFGTNSFYLNKTIDLTKKNSISLEFEFYLNLGIGYYQLDIACHPNHDHYDETYHWLVKAIDFNIVNNNKFHFIGSNFLNIKIK